uniref:Lipoprotein n=1 Tax=viral metagenome TaxID=1070528 RepID=A0A6M3L7K2_9ZZZZ
MGKDIMCLSDDWDTGPIHMAAILIATIIFLAGCGAGRRTPRCDLAKEGYLVSYAKGSIEPGEGRYTVEDLRCDR